MRVVSLLFHDVYVDDPRESGFSSGAADRYKLSLAEIETQLAGLAGARRDAPLRAGSSSRVERGDGATGRLKAAPTTLAALKVAPACDGLPFLLTVDDGGISYYTLLADRLEALGWRGHCFVTTDLIGRTGFLDAAHIRELDARGHVIGSHSASHPGRFSACASEAMRQEWSRSRKVLEDLLGHDVAVASVPGGYYSRRVARAARDAGLRLLFTSEPTVATQDESGCTVIGRFTIRHGDKPDLARRLASPSPWARHAAWTRWNAKGLVKPLLGPAYGRVADWVCAGRAVIRNHA